MKTAGQTDFATWHVPQCVFVIEYSRALLAEIEWNVLEAFDGGRGGGVETAGVLFGIHLEGVLRITGFRPIECEHRYGPAFILSDTDRANLGGLLEKSSREPALDGVAVGWYHSHTRSGVFLSGADLELHRRFFPETWQVALVLRPSLNMATRAGFFFQETDGAIRTQDCYREFELAGVESAVTRTHAMRSAGMEGRGADAGGSQKPNGPIHPVQAASAAAPLAPAEAGPTGKSKMRHWPWLAAGLLLGIAGASWYHSATVRPLVPTRAAPLRLRVMDQSGLLRIEWDRNKLAATELLGGSLEIQDGKNKTNLPLDRAAIQMGSLEVLRHSQVVRVTLKIRVLGAGPIEEVTEFSGPTPTAEVPPDEPGDKQRVEGPSKKKDRGSGQDLRSEAPEKPGAPARHEGSSTVVSGQVAGASPAKAVPPRQPVAAAARSAVEKASTTPPALLAGPPPQPSGASLSGHWVHGAAGPTSSPFPPQSLLLTLTESAGRLRGVFSGIYKVPEDRKVNGKVDFQFVGPAGAGPARFPFTAADGSKGEVEIIRLPGNAEAIEVVWHSNRDQVTFDDVLRRVP